MAIPALFIPSPYQIPSDSSAPPLRGFIGSPQQTKNTMKIQKTIFTGGIFEPKSFALHKITGNFKGKCSAWYSSAGELTDCEWIRPDGQTRIIPPHKPMWNYLKSLGPIWK